MQLFTGNLSKLEVTLGEAEGIRKFIGSLAPGAFIYRCSQCKKAKTNVPFTVEIPAAGEALRLLCQPCS